MTSEKRTSHCFMLLSASVGKKLFKGNMFTTASQQPFFVLFCFFLNRDFNFLEPTNHRNNKCLDYFGERQKMTARAVKVFIFSICVVTL